MLYQTIPYHNIPYHTIPHHTIPYHTIQCHATFDLLIWILDPSSDMLSKDWSVAKLSLAPAQLDWVALLSLCPSRRPVISSSLRPTGIVWKWLSKALARLPNKNYHLTYQTNPSKPNLANKPYQTNQTKPTKSNQTKHTQLNLANQTYNTKPTKPNLQYKTYQTKSKPGTPQLALSLAQLSLRL